MTNKHNSENQNNRAIKKSLTIAVAGNPNAGKSTLINAIAGTKLHVGNWPGVTVEKKSADFEYKGRRITLVDLPGTYSLSPYTQEEVIARDYLVHEKPDIVLNVVDATNLERNLYFTFQLLELGIPLVMALNMHDEARQKGLRIDAEKMESILGCAVIPTVATKHEGIDRLIETAIAFADDPGRHAPCAIPYGADIEAAVKTVLGDLQEYPQNNSNSLPKRWLALKLMERDELALKESGVPADAPFLTKATRHLRQAHGEDIEALMADERYGLAAGLTREALQKPEKRKRELTERIDAVVLNRFLGMPLFLALMYLVFSLTFTLGDPPMGWIENFFGWSGSILAGLWPEGSESLLKSLLVDGIIGGVGGVIVFLPNILLLFLAIAILEDSGYMARVAFIMDRLMHKIGLHGKSFIPMLIGFGCSVPAIMATRTLENRRDRLTTMLVTPLMSCGARLPIYLLIIPAFFPPVWHAPMLWIIYVIGILIAVVTAKLLRSTLFKGESVPFVMELPPYRMPTPKGVLIHMWERGWLYLKKAGTIILGISILMWAMTTFPGLPDRDTARFANERQAIQAAAAGKEEKSEQMASIENQAGEEALRYSIAGRIGQAIEPILTPVGFDWKIGTALIGAFAAKEVFVAQMGIIYSVGKANEESETLREKLKNTYTPLIGFCIMLFCLISAPCMATIAVTGRESGSWKWAMLQLGGLTLLAYVLTFIVFQTGTLLGVGI
ncbi:MAG: ferrous iron transport protein B [Syntrophaceae bacterium]|nr:MAG: ferrous iron transport protein B [Syntrophaceae bacterium]